MTRFGQTGPVPEIDTSLVNADAMTMLEACMVRMADELAHMGLAPDCVHRMMAQARAQVLQHFHLCESPLEQIMLAALGTMVVPGAECFPPAIHDARHHEPWPARAVVVVPQFWVARYRLDFLVRISYAHGPVLLAVECDGAAHHTSRSDQTRDRGRDLYLTALGIHTVRYSGQMLFRRGPRMADEIVALLQGTRNAA